MCMFSDFSPSPLYPTRFLIKSIIKVSRPAGVFIVWKMWLIPPWLHWMKKNTYFSVSHTYPLIPSLLSANLNCYLPQWVSPPEGLCQVPLSVINTPVVSLSLFSSTFFFSRKVVFCVNVLWLFENKIDDVSDLSKELELSPFCSPGLSLGCLWVLRCVLISNWLKKTDGLGNSGI